MLTTGDMSSDSTTNHQPKMVLVVEDDPDVQAVIVSALQEAGYRVVSARSGVEALRLARTERPDAITLDLLLPVHEQLGLGVSSEFFHRKTYYQDGVSTPTKLHYPQFRAYFTWRVGS